METAKRILIFNVNWLGDVLFSTAAIRAVRSTYPDSFIACAIPARCYQIIEGNPHVNEVIIFDEKGSHRTLAGKIVFIRFLARKKFDTVYLLHRSFSRALLCALAGIPNRIGHTSPKRAFLLTTRIEPPARDSVHRIDYYLTVVRQAGCVDAGRAPDLHVSGHDERAAVDFLEKKGIGDGDRVIVLNPGGNWMQKRWPAAHWAELADRLAGEAGMRVIFSGGTQDEALVKEIRGMMQGEAVSACGALTIKQLAALARMAQVFVTADSGPLHIAAAAGSRHIVALFGPTLPELTGPVCDTRVTILQKRGHCVLPCYEVGCKDNACMKRLSVQDVFAAIVTAAGGESS